MIHIKGYDIKPIVVKDSFNRRAQQFKNNIVSVLRTIGVHEDDVDIELERVALKKAPATASW